MRVPVGTSGTTNMIRVHVVGEILLRGVGIDDEIAFLASKALAIVTEEGGLTSHVAVLGISYDIPVIVDAKQATSVLTDGALVTVDATRGLIYQGEINAK